MANFTGMTPEALAAWEALQATYGQPLNVLSAYRDPEHNARVGGAKNSQHTHGNAFDVDVGDLSIEERQALIRLAQENGFRGIGVYDGSLHFDVGPERAWGPSFSRDSLPDWASAYVGGSNALSGPQAYPVAMPESPENALALREMERSPYHRMQDMQSMMWQGHDPAMFMSRRRFG